MMKKLLTLLKPGPGGSVPGMKVNLL